MRRMLALAVGYSRSRWYQLEEALVTMTTGLVELGLRLGVLIVFLLILLLLFAGCGSTAWYHPMADEAQFRRDVYACTRDAAMLPRQIPLAATSPYGYGSNAAARLDAAAARWADRDAQQSLFRQCMESKGYSETRE